MSKWYEMDLALANTILVHKH